VIIIRDNGEMYRASKAIEKQLSKVYEKGSKEYVNAAHSLLDMYKANPSRFGVFNEVAFKKVSK
jgi:hypothetical protein